MEEDYVILKRHVAEPSPSLEAVYGKPYTEDGGSEDRLAVEQVRLERKELESIRCQDEFVCAAPNIPLLHISPASRDPAFALDEQFDASWGIKAVNANETEMSGAGSVVAVLDTGIDPTHQAFTHIRDRIVQKNFTNEADEDYDGHGTHCAGTIFGGTMDGTQVGLAPGIQRALIGKVIGAHGCDSARLHQALQWAVESGANIISLSLGFDFAKYANQLSERWPRDVAFSKAMLAYQDNLELFAAFAQQFVVQRYRPMLLVAAAGNEARRNEHSEHVIAKSLPAAAPGFVAVGAVQRRNGDFEVAPFSNTGPRVCAPGVNVLSTIPGGKLATMSGTSMAVPHVSGVAALWLEWLNKKYQNVSGQLLLDKIVGSATDERIIDASERDTGAGLVAAP